MLFNFVFLFILAIHGGLRKRYLGLEQPTFPHKEKFCILKIKASFIKKISTFHVIEIIALLQKGFAMKCLLLINSLLPC